MVSRRDDPSHKQKVIYSRDRTDGLIDSDIIESLTAVYGDPVLKSARSRPAAALPDTVVLAQWDSPGSSVTLFRGYSEKEIADADAARDQVRTTNKAAFRP